MTAQDNAPARLYTADEFEALVATPEYADRRLELIDGEMVEKMVTIEHGMIVLRIGARILAYLDQHPIGRVGPEIHHRVAGDPHNVRVPDLGLIVNEPNMPVDTTSPRLPDLAVEVKSRANTLADLQDKARYYVAHGTRLVWIVVPSKQFVIVVTPTTEDILDAADTLTGGDVLPGFTLPVAEIFKDTQAAAPTEVKPTTEEG